ncbi:MAG: SpoIID/LytB domain-containing protein [Elusimicrobiales bacterium]
MFFCFLLAFYLFCHDSSHLIDKAYKSYLSGDYERAAEYYTAAWEEGKEINALLDLAMIYKFSDRYSKAISALEKYTEFRKDTDVLSEIGWLYFHISNYEKAIEYFKMAVDIDTANYNAYLGLASVYSHIRDFINTEEYLKKYRQLRGDYAGVDYIFAWNYANFNMYDMAKNYLIETLRKDPNFVEARFPLAQLYLKEGDYNNAWNQYYRILEFFPDHPVATSMVKLIEGKLTKQPEEIRKPFRIENPTIIDESYSIDSFRKSPRLRIAIATDSMGKHRQNRRIKLRSFVKVDIYSKKTWKNIFSFKPGDVIDVVYSNGSFSFYKGKTLVFSGLRGSVVVRPYDIRNGSVIIEADPKNTNPYFRYSDREYRGFIELVPFSGGFGIVNVVELELYLLGVVGAEMEPKWPLEALKSQAVIARTEALRRMKEGPHRKDGYHLCDTQHCQVYKGVGYETKSVTKAVFETQGLVLTYKDRLAYTFYHSNCGGFIQSSQEVGWGNVPYLISHPDNSEESKRNLSPWEFNIWIKKNPPAYCNYPGVVSDTEYRWLRIIKRSDLAYKLNERYKIGDLKSIVILRRSTSGHVNSIKIVGSKRSVVIEKEHIIRNTFGISSLKSTLFNIEINRYPDGRIRNIWFYGGGWGHSIGLCQGGAAGMAGKLGKKYNEILEFYFPQTKIKKVIYK